MRVRLPLFLIFIIAAVAGVILVVKNKPTTPEVKKKYSVERWKILQKAKNNLSSFDAETRSRAVNIIRDLDGKEIIKDIFEKALTEEESDVLEGLLFLIGRWGDETMIPPLTELKYKKYKGGFWGEISMYRQVSEAIKKIRNRAFEERNKRQTRQSQQ